MKFFIDTVLTILGKLNGRKYSDYLSEMRLPYAQLLHLENSWRTIRMTTKITIVMVIPFGIRLNESDDEVVMIEFVEREKEIIYL